MTAFRILLATIFLTLLGYTGVTIAHHGWDLFSVFFGDIALMGWPGQFNADFMSLLTLLGLWVGWRHGFSAKGIALGVLASLTGSLFLSLYLLILSFQTRDVAEMLTGRQAHPSST